MAEGRRHEDGSSLSGREHNRLFANLGNGRFANVSGVSGADTAADGRSFAWMDVDRDGALDIVEANANTPLLEVFLNDTVAPESTHSFAAVRLVGGSRGAASSKQWSNRDGIGARVSVATTDGRTIVRTLRAGEGFAAQNSATLHFGLGPAAKIAELTVRWPSGLVSKFNDLPTGRLVTVYEDAGNAPSGEALRIEPYSILPRIRRGAVGHAHATTVATDDAVPKPLRPGPGSARLRVAAAFATWCTGCRNELPEFRFLSNAFDSTEVEFVGVPADRFDRDDAIREWVEKYRPPYEMLVDLSKESRDEIHEQIIESLGRDGLPVTFITDRDGHILSARFGAPTVSEIRTALDHAAD